MSVLAVPTGGARVDQICRILDGLAKLTAEEFERALPDLGNFITVVDALIERDDVWQRRFKREVVVALTKVPKESNDDVPTKHSLRWLHRYISWHGPANALDRLAESPAPSWPDLVRTYAPTFRLRQDWTVERQHEEAFIRATRKERDNSPKSLRVYRDRLFKAREVVGRLEHIIKECEALGLSDWATVPTDVLRPPNERKKPAS